MIPAQLFTFRKSSGLSVICICSVVPNCNWLSATKSTLQNFIIINWKKIIRRASMKRYIFYSINIIILCCLITMCKILLCRSKNDAHLFFYRRYYFVLFPARWVDLLCISCKMVPLNRHLEMKILQRFLILHVASILQSNNPLDICLFQRTTFH